MVQGLLWTIISKFQVADIVIEGVSGKDGLLLWCKRQTAGYPGIDIDDFAKSWENGMAFLAILHKHRPETIDLGGVSPANKAANVALAFRVAEEVRRLRVPLALMTCPPPPHTHTPVLQFFGVEPLFDVEDLVDVKRPDEKIVLTYVSLLFKGCAEFLHNQVCDRAREAGSLAQHSAGPRSAPPAP